ncbi:MAG: uracil phosphoribosyltransferase [Saprospiraceae bacterium]|nr:uracil phosphoribosyltransferase [Saprospiraceae bacterium]
MSSKMVNNLSEKNSYFNQIIYELRHISIQRDRAKFRNNLEKFGFLAGYEISKSLNFSAEEVQTSLGSTIIETIDDSIVILSILRAGIPLQYGLLKLMDQAETGFIAAYRKEKPDGSFDIKMDYITCPDLNEKIVIFTDPMLATGSSLDSALKMIENYGTPKELHLISIIASEYALEQIRRLYPTIHIWVGAIDEELTAKSYIVPGLGDAGDLAYGEKLQG